MIPHEVPNQPWSKLGADIFTYSNNDHLLVVDYFSKYPEVVSLPDKPAVTVIRKLEAIFSRHGVPDVFMSDNMPFAASEMKQFASEWGFKLVTPSPTYPRSNGLSERYAQTVKQLLRKAHEEGKSPQRALLDYRTSPVAGMKYSQSNLLISWSLKGTILVKEELLQPEEVVGAKHQLDDRQQKQEQYYNRGTKDLTELHPGSGIRIRQGRTWEPAVVLQDHGAPRSYLVMNSKGQVYRKNRQYLLAPGNVHRHYEDAVPPQTAPQPAANPQPADTRITLWSLPFSTYAILHAIWTHPPPFRM